MIWGAILKPGEAYTELVVEEIRLSMASLEYRSSKTAVPSPTSHVVISTPKGEYLLCSLEKGSIPQQSLDLVLKPKEEVTFIIEGTGVVHLTGYTQESPQQFVQCSPEEEEMIFVDEQGSDEPDIGSSSQAQNNIDSGGDVATNQVLSEHSSQILNSSKPADTSCQGAIVKMENLSDSPGEDLYEGWIAEDNQLMPKSPDPFQSESMIVNNLLQSVLFDDDVNHEAVDGSGGNDGEDDGDDDDNGDDGGYDDDVSSMGYEDNSDDGDWNPHMADFSVADAERGRRIEKTQDHVDEDDSNQTPEKQVKPSSKKTRKSAVIIDEDDDDDNVVGEEEEGDDDEENQSTARKTKQTENREQNVLSGVEANNGRCDDESSPRSVGSLASVRRSSRNRWRSTRLLACTKSKPFVEPSKTTAATGRIWDKYSYCLYCSKRQCKLVRHLKRIHGDEVLVAKAVALYRERNIPESLKIWSKIRNHGNFEHNKKVHLGEADDLIVVKRPEYWQSCSIASYTPCSDCLGYFLSKSLWKHKTVCSERKKKANEGKRHVREGRSLIPLKHTVSDQLRMVVSGLVEDKISAIIRNDKDILDVGERDIEVIRCVKKEQTIRSKMRLLANAVDIGRSLNNKISCGEDLVKPAAFETVGKVGRVMSGYNENTKEYEYFSNIRKLGFAVRDLALVVRGRFIRSGEKEQASEVDKFLRLRETKWSRVTGCHQEVKDPCCHPEILIVTEYYLKLCDYLSKEENRIKAGFAKDGELSSEDLTRLIEVTFAQVLLFNRHRSGEVESLEMSKYLQKIEKMEPIEEETKQSLTIPEVVALERLKHLRLLVKEGRNSLILLTESMKKSLDIIVKFQQESDDGQIYLFSEDASTPLAGSSIIPKLAEQAGLQHPKNVYCVNFHRQIATVVQLQELRENELEQLATLMGHNIVVHCEYYRMPQESLLIAKLMKLLTLIEKEKLNKFQERSLEEVEVTSDELLQCFQYKPEPFKVDEGKKKPSNTGKQSKSSKQVRKYRTWRKVQENYLFSHPEIKWHIRKQRPPGKYVAELVIRQSKGLLSGKSWKDVKYKVYNEYKKKKSWKQSNKRMPPIVIK